MSSTTGIAAIGTYTVPSLAAKVAVLLALIPNPDSTSTGGAQAGGGNLDEMSPVAAAHLRVELAALAASGAGGGASASGSRTVTAGEVTATQTDIVTGLADLDLTKGSVVIRRAGSVVTGDAAITEPTAGTIRVKSGVSTYTLTAGDIIYWVANAP